MGKTTTWDCDRCGTRAHGLAAVEKDWKHERYTDALLCGDCDRKLRDVVTAFVTLSDAPVQGPSTETPK